VSIRWEYAADLVWGRSHPILEPEWPWVDGGDDPPPHPSEVKHKRQRAARNTLVSSAEVVVPVVEIELTELPKSLRRDPVTDEARPASLLDAPLPVRPPPPPKVIDVPKPPPPKPRVIVTPGAKFGKPFGVYGKIKDHDLRAMHRLHRDDGTSVRELGRIFWRLYGYSSASSCCTCISAGWKRMGLETRSKSEATAKANRERHLGKPTCKFVSARGLTCDKVPLTESPYCAKHKPEVIAEGIANLRAREGR